MQEGDSKTSERNIKLKKKHFEFEKCIKETSGKDKANSAGNRASKEKDEHKVDFKQALFQQLEQPSRQQCGLK